MTVSKIKKEELLDMTAVKSQVATAKVQERGNEELDYSMGVELMRLDTRPDGDENVPVLGQVNRGMLVPLIFISFILQLVDSIYT